MLLFEALRAWFSPLVAPADRAQWCHLGGQVPSARAIEAHETAIDLFFGVWGYPGNDHLVARVLDLGLDVVDYRWVAHCAGARTLVDVRPYCFRSLMVRDGEGLLRKFTFSGTSPRQRSRMSLSPTEAGHSASDDSLDAHEVQHSLVLAPEPQHIRLSGIHKPYRPSRLSQVTRFSSESESPSTPTRHPLRFPLIPDSASSPAPVQRLSSPALSSQTLGAPSRGPSCHSPPSPPLSSLFLPCTNDGSPTILFPDPQHRRPSLVSERIDQYEAACRQDPVLWHERSDYTATAAEEPDQGDDSGYFEQLGSLAAHEGRKRNGDELDEEDRSARRRTASEEILVPYSGSAPEPEPELELKVEEPASPALRFSPAQCGFFPPLPSQFDPSLPRMSPGPSSASLAPFFASVVVFPDSAGPPTFSIAALLSRLPSALPELKDLEGSARSAALRTGLSTVVNGKAGFVATRIRKSVV